MCDLERRKVIDLLPDRSAESTAAWLKRHPAIEIVSRDRASLYAEAIDRAAPHAIQVADRWHLLRNLSEALTGVLAPHHRIMTEAARAMSKRPVASPIKRSTAEPIPTRAMSAKQGRRDRRLSRYESVVEQVRNGLSQAEISCRLGIDRRTIRRWTRSDGFPERKPVFRMNSIDEHRLYLDQRWEEGCHNASQLWRELRERGFTGMDSIVRNWVRQHYGRRSSRAQQEPVAPQQPRVSPRQTTWQILKSCESGRAYLEELYRHCPEVATAARVAKEFFRIG